MQTLCQSSQERSWLAPQIRQLIINIAQTNHRFTTNMQRRLYGHATDVAVRPLDEEKAVQAAADLLGELFVFSAMKQRDEDIAREVELLKHKLEELEQLAKGRGLSGLFHFRHPHHAEDEKAKSV